MSRVHECGTRAVNKTGTCQSQGCFAFGRCRAGKLKVAKSHATRHSARLYVAMGETLVWRAVAGAVAAVSMGVFTFAGRPGPSHYIVQNVDKVQPGV
jgi:hypothetical protein